VDSMYGMQPGTKARREEKGFHTGEVTGTKVQREALCSSLSMNPSFTSTCAR
jgi:hypothetical protein